MTSTNWTLPKKIPQADGIRGLACLFVLIHHYYTGLYVPPLGIGAWIMLFVKPFLESGVDLFFVLSGFLIGGILIDQKNSPNFFFTFYLRRVCRIFPVNYFLFASFALILLTELPAHLSGSQWLFSGPAPVWSYAIFSQNIFLGLNNTAGAHWIGVTWSLAVEEQFYLCFPLLLFWVPKNYISYFAVTICLVAIVVRQWAVTRYGFYAGYMWLPCRMDALMMGVIVAQLLRNGRVVTFLLRNIKAVYGTLLAITLLILINLVHHVLFGGLEYTAIAAVYALIIMVAVLRENSIFARILKTRFLIFTGLLSYALYMYHQAVNGTLHMLIFHDEPRMQTWQEFAVTSFAVVLAFLAAYVSQIVLERPIRNWGHQFKYLPAQHSAMPE